MTETTRDGHIKRMNLYLTNTQELIVRRRQLEDELDQVVANINANNGAIHGEQYWIEHLSKSNGAGQDETTAPIEIENKETETEK